MERAELAQALGATAGAQEARNIFISESEPGRFMAAFAQAAANGGNVFLCDPLWGPNEREELAVRTGNQILAEAQRAQSEKSEILNLKSEIAGVPARGWLMIASGGTSGRLKFARHDQDTLRAAVDGFSAHFNVSRVNAVGVLPLHHVSGLMAWMRCALTGGMFLPTSWSEIEAGRRPAMGDGGEWFLSLVPTQLQRLLAQPETIGWLRRFR
ncbi:MAG TPA: hypothetical protein VNW30_08470, partial [Opitutaceae bacterium]|nr:hypothetical protein [Opitutaceae bacterium]